MVRWVFKALKTARMRSMLGSQRHDVQVFTFRFLQMHLWLSVGLLGAGSSTASGSLSILLKNFWSIAFRARRGCSGLLLTSSASCHSLLESLHQRQDEFSWSSAASHYTKPPAHSTVIRNEVSLQPFDLGKTCLSSDVTACSTSDKSNGAGSWTTEEAKRSSMLRCFTQPQSLNSPPHGDPPGSFGWQHRSGRL